MSRTIRRQSGNRWWKTNQKWYNWRTGEHEPFHDAKFLREIEGDTFKYWSGGHFIKSGVKDSERALQKAQMDKLKKCNVQSDCDDFDYDPSGEVINSQRVHMDY